MRYDNMSTSLGRRRDDNPEALTHTLNKEVLLFFSACTHIGIHLLSLYFGRDLKRSDGKTNPKLQDHAFIFACQHAREELPQQSFFATTLSLTIRGSMISNNSGRHSYI